ncbi:MAG TPA: hypothetical protein DCK93_01265 [Blastocatellia bacterium]|nr:hypothetical protein [Blastocatellia bacterium]
MIEGWEKDIFSGQRRLGFGMGRDREDIADASNYVSELRDAEMRTPEGCEKTPEEFLQDADLPIKS